MTLKECYAALEGDYENVLGRLMTEKLVQKFALKFLDDKSFELLKTSLAEGNGQEAFRAAHTIKGICQNLSFTKLYGSSSRLTDALRDGQAEVDPALLAQVESDYDRTADVLREYQSQL